MAAARHNLSRRAVLGAGAAVAAVAAIGTDAAAADQAPAESAPVAEPPQHRTPRIAIVCRECGRSNVSRDAWADWDVEAQDWVLGAVFDDAYCHDCEDEMRLEEVGLPAQDSPTG